MLPAAGSTVSGNWIGSQSFDQEGGYTIILNGTNKIFDTLNLTTGINNLTVNGSIIFNSTDNTLFGTLYVPGTLSLSNSSSLGVVGDIRVPATGRITGASLGVAGSLSQFDGTIDV